MASTVQKSFRLPTDVVEKLDALGNITEYVVAALREKFERDELERFKASARRIADASSQDKDVEFAFAAQTEVLSEE